MEKKKKKKKSILDEKNTAHAAGCSVMYRGPAANPVETAKKKGKEEKGTEVTHFIASGSPLPALAALYVLPWDRPARR